VCALPFISDDGIAITEGVPLDCLTARRTTTTT
jgi:hypothetical protein